MYSIGICIYLKDEDTEAPPKEQQGKDRIQSDKHISTSICIYIYT